MEWYWSLTLLMGMALGLMALGLPVALAFFGTNLFGAYIFFGGEAGLIQVVRNTIEALTKFSLAPVVIFVLMGEILFESGVAARAIDAVDRLISKVPGRLSVVAVVGGTVFSTLSGSTMANTVLLGNTLLPEMRKRGYSKGMAMGPILGTGGIAMLIPPSGLAVLLGSLSGISISKILIAGAIPGVLMAIIHFSYVIVRCWRNPSLAPVYDVPAMSWGERIRPTIIYVLPLFSLFVFVVGAIFTGVATPTESASLGAVGALIAALVYRSFSWRKLFVALRETGRISVMIFFIAGASLSFAQVLDFSGATLGLLQTIESMELEGIALVAGMVLLMIVLGCFIDPLSIMVITLPFFIPLAKAAGIDLIWLGVLMLLALEIGQTTPPFGVLLFCMKSVAPPEYSMRDIYAAVLPFVTLELILLMFLVAFPSVVTWLPELMQR